MRIKTVIAGLLLAGSALAGTQETVTLDVQNMTCSGCRITVKMALEQVPGVSDVTVDFERKTATVHIEVSKANAGMLTKATTDAGFPSTVRK